MQLNRIREKIVLTPTYQGKVRGQEMGRGRISENIRNRDNITYFEKIRDRIRIVRF